MTATATKTPLAAALAKATAAAKPKRASGHRCAAARVAKKAPTPVTWTVTQEEHIVNVAIDGLKLVSEANQRGNWRVSQGRKQTQRAVVSAALQPIPVLWYCKLPLRITLTRVGPRMLDDDNLAGSAKLARDSVAKHVGIDDGDSRLTGLTWEYLQRKGDYGLVITFESAEFSDIYGARRARDR